jgi:hypothetical protein
MLREKQLYIQRGDNMSDSKLVNYTLLSPNKTTGRNHAIDTITIHCMAGNLSVVQCGALFAKPDRKASSNYGIDSNGKIALYVKESDRSWCSSSRDNDNRAITIEVANDGGAETGWHVSDKAYVSLINLLVDVCQRNGIKKLLWKGDKSLIGQVDKQNMTVHRWFANKACPGDYLYNLHSKIAEDVNSRLSNNTIKIQNEKKSYEVDQIMWDKFKEAGFSDFAVAGIMGNLQVESGLRSNNLQNSYEKKLGMDDDTYTAAVNCKAYSKEAFIYDKAGYGLAQWTYWSRKEGLYNYLIEHNMVGIDSFAKQIDYIIYELNTAYKGILPKLSKCKSVREATSIVMKDYERPADQSDTALNKRASYAQTFYNKFVKGNTNAPFLVKVKVPNLNIRKGPGTDQPLTGKVTGIGTFTIVDIAVGKGSINGWGLLKSYSNKKDGWISLDYVERT